LELGFEGCMAEVFFYLWEDQVYKKGDGSSSHEVFKGVRALHLSRLLVSGHVVPTEKNVDQALSDLCTIGMINKLKPGKKRRSEGRPPKAIYAVKSAPEIMRLLGRKLEAKKQTLFDVFGQLEDFEALGNSALVGGDRNAA